MKIYEQNKYKKKKVLFLIHTLQVGGAEKILVELVNNLDKTKFDVTVMTVVDTGAFKKELNENIKYRTIIKKPFKSNNELKNNKKNNKEKSGNLLNGGTKLKKVLINAYSYFWKKVDCKKIYKKYIKEEYDVEVAFLEGISAKIIANSTNEKSKKIAWIHVDLLKERKTEKFFKGLEDEKEIYEKFNNIICVSKQVKENFIKKYNYSKPQNVLIKYNPIDEKKILNKMNEKIEDIDKTKTTLCSIGRLSKQKGFDRLINVVERLKKNGIDIDLWIIGVGAEEEKLKSLIKSKALYNVKLLGYKSNPYKYIKKSDIFVSSSRAEGFSTVISEAIILEKVIVATDCSGTKEMLGENNEYGIVTENSEEGLYNGIYKLLQQKELYKMYSNIIKERKNMFMFKNMIIEIEEVLGGKIE